MKCDLKTVALATSDPTLTMTTSLLPTPLGSLRAHLRIPTTGEGSFKRVYNAWRYPRSVGRGSDTYGGKRVDSVVSPMSSIGMLCVTSMTVSRAKAMRRSMRAFKTGSDRCVRPRNSRYVSTEHAQRLCGV